MLPTNPYGTTTEPVETRTVEQAVIDGSVVSETVDVLLINPTTGARSATKAVNRMLTADGRLADATSVQRCSTCRQLISANAVRSCTACQHVLCARCTKTYAGKEVCRSCRRSLIIKAFFRLS